MAESTKLWLESELQRILRAAIEDGTPFGSVVVHLEGDRVRLRSRAEVAAELHDAGVRDLERRIERATVPAGCFLGFIDCDGLTAVHVVSLAEALGEEPSAQGTANAAPTPAPAALWRAQ
jgi:hypothetical protein